MRYLISSRNFEVESMDTFSWSAENLRDSVPKIIGTFLIRACQVHYHTDFTSNSI